MLDKLLRKLPRWPTCQQPLRCGAVPTVWCCRKGCSSSQATRAYVGAAGTADESGMARDEAGCSQGRSNCQSLGTELSVGVVYVDGHAVRQVTKDETHM